MMIETTAPPPAAGGLRRHAGKALLAIAVLALLAAPQVASSYHLTLLIPFFGYAIVLVGFNLLFGYGGQLSFGHAMFVAIGAYGAAVAARMGTTSFEAMLAVAVLGALAVSLPIAALASRFTGIFFGMLTLSFGMLFHSFLFKFYDLTGGESGMRVPRPTLFGNAFDDLDKTAWLTGPFYHYTLVLLALLVFLMWRLVRSPVGLHLQAARDNENKAAYLGVKVRQVRTLAFVVSAVYGAIGGVILGVNTGLADPELAYWTHSGHIVFMAVLGGYQEFLGPVAGALGFILMQDSLMSATQYWRFFLGVALAALVIALPGGLLGGARRIVGGITR
jgi:branched-chain amino acid transport system permease protein